MCVRSSDDITTLKIPSDPKKENFVFDGWFWDDGSWEKPFTVNSILDQPVSEYMNMTVYAKWKGVSVSVSMKNGETAETKQIEYGAPYVLPVPTGEAGDKFLGWATGADKKDFLTDEAGKSLSDCDFLSAEAVAVWKEGKIALTLNAGKGRSIQKFIMRSKASPWALPVPFWTASASRAGLRPRRAAKVGEASVLDGELTLYAMKNQAYPHYIRRKRRRKRSRIRRKPRPGGRYGWNTVLSVRTVRSRAGNATALSISRMKASRSNRANT
ncbi:MAG: InlB B-repeat-containing protein [Christensenellaceae bacterium]